jgi:RNA recognition motif-containing protein
MSTPEEAEAAIGALNSKSIDGRALTVNVAKPREERSGGDRRSYSGARGQYSR